MTWRDMLHRRQAPVTIITTTFPPNAAPIVLTIVSTPAAQGANSAATTTPNAEPANPNPQPATTTPATSSTSQPNNAIPSTSSPVTSSTRTASSIAGASSSSSALITTALPSSSAAAAPATSSTAAQPVVRNGFSSGAVAGFAIGFFVLGALLAAAAAFLLTRRSRNRRSTARKSAYDSEKGGDLLGAAALGRRTHGTPFEEYLGQPASDNDIAKEFSTVRTRIEGYIANYYNAPPTDVSAAAEAVHAQLGPQSPIVKANLVGLLSDGRTRQAVLQSALAWVILSRMGSSGDSRRSLLPPETAGLYGSMRHRAGSDNKNHEASAALLTKWRQITAVLSKSDRDDQSYDASLSPQIQQTVAEADSFLRYFAPADSSTDRLQKLAEIVKRAARFNALLFAQPTEYDFDWSAQSGGSGVVTYPGLVQTTGEDGRGLSSPRAFPKAEAVVVSTEVGRV